VEGVKVIIVGGVAAGASAAARLRRLDENAEIIIMERGEYISFANCGLPYYVGGIIEKRNRLLVQTPKSMHSRFNLDVRINNEVIKISRGEKRVEVRDIKSEKVYTESYDYLVLCPGASPVIPDIPGIDKHNIFTVRNLPDSDIIKSYIELIKPSKAVVVGGGFIGLEMADMLNEAGVQVSLVEASAQVMGALDAEMAAMVHDYLGKQGINLYLGTKVIGFEGEKQVQLVNLDKGISLETDMVVLGIGVKPEISLAQNAGLAIGATGGILVNDYLQTSDPSVYAAGDAIQVKDRITEGSTLLPMAGPANRQGWIVANNIAGRSIKYSGVQGTAIVKIMKLAAAVTGKNEKDLQKLGWDYKVCHVIPSSHATYYPGATDMTIKALFDPASGKLLGAQIIGYDGVDKRIDVLATAIRAKMTVFDLQELELAYAPPFSSAKDPINMVGYTAANIVNRDVEVITWDVAMKKAKEGSFLVDLRTAAEIKKDGTVEEAIIIPVDEIRQKLDEIPRDYEVLLYCRSGLRSYVGYRILKQLGYNVLNIDGGYLMHKNYIFDK
jgi:Uncharacterized NAD(FAD)-dependent dehydrogenases